MPLTEAEQTLQRKYAELRRKKEERKQKAAQEEAKKQAAATGPAASTADPQSALEKAKALLAKKGTGAAPKSTDKPNPSSSTPQDPIAAAKQKLQQQAQKKAAATQKRPTIKRPTVQRAAPKSDDAEPASGRGGSPNHEARDSGAMHSSGEHRASKRPRTDNGARDPPESSGPADSTIFVGDLPPYYTREDVMQLFSHFGALADVRVMGSQCYGFVTFQRPEAAQEVLQRFSQKPIVASGHELRINIAYGELPEWKKGPSGPQSEYPSPGNNAGGRQMHVHPKVAHAREYGEDLARQLVAAGAHGLDFNAVPQQRELISYDDL